MNVLRVENDSVNSKLEEVNAKIKQLEHESTLKEQEISSLTHRNQLLDSEIEKLEGQVKELKTNAEDDSGHKVISFSTQFHLLITLRILMKL